MKKKEKKLIKLLLAVCAAAVVVFFGFKLINRCDNCDKIFIGPGYEANVISDTLSKDDKILCKACAEKDHAVELVLGKSLSDFKRGLFD